MKTLTSKFYVMLTLCLCIGTMAYAQGSAESIEKEMDHHKHLKTYVIEREMPGAHDLSAEELKGASKNSNQVLADLGSENIVWMHSYVAEDKIYCVYQAKNKELVKKHAEKAGFPANSVREVAAVISPETGK